MLRCGSGFISLGFGEAIERFGLILLGGAVWDRLLMSQWRLLYLVLWGCFRKLGLVYLIIGGCLWIIRWFSLISRLLLRFWLICIRFSWRFIRTIWLSFNLLCNDICMLYFSFLFSDFRGRLCWFCLVLFSGYFVLSRFLTECLC